MHKISIIIPVYNEVATIEEIIRRVNQVHLDLDKEIILVDDYSTDGTRDVIQRIEGGDIKKIFLEKNQGKGAAIRSALKYISGDIIIIQDADLEYHPDEFPQLISPILEKKADVVFGSRFIGAHRCFLFTHYLGNKIVNLIANLVYNTTLSDFMTGYKVITAGVLKDIFIKSNRFGFEAEITGLLLRKNLRIYEIPISYSGRDYSEGKKIKWYDFFVVLWWLIYSRFRPTVDIQYNALDELSKTINYNSYIYRKFKKYLGGRILELGCGIGNITQLLIKNREIVVALDKSETQLFYLVQRIPESSLFKIYQCDIENSPLNISTKFKFDSVVCINVLEHIKDDRKLIMKIYDTIEKGGKIILVLPAQKMLFSKFDQSLGHFRRYDKEMIEKLLIEQGFIIEKIEYFNFLGIISWWFNFKVLKRNGFSSFQLFIFNHLIWLVEIFDNLIRSSGLSLLVVAKK